MMRVSRSAIQTRRDCAAKRYWGFDYKGAGLERRTASLPLVNGDHLHSAHARIVMGANVDQVLAEQAAAYTRELHIRGVSGTRSEHLTFLLHEQLALMEGLVRGWVKFRLPLILDEYEPVAAEQEWLVDMGDGFQLPLRIDLLLRHRGDGLLHIRDFKTLAYLRDGWREGYLHDLQTLLYIEAAERHTGEYVGGMEYEALLKGKRGSYKTGPWTAHDLQQSPLCYGYAIDNKDGSVAYQSGYTKVKGSRKFATWEEFSDVEEWLTEHLEEQVWREMFVTTGMIAPTAAMRKIALRQVQRGEWAHVLNVDTIDEMVREGVNVSDAVTRVLEPNTASCYQYGTRYACPFLDICHTGADPEAEDSPLILREDHHEIEEPVLEEAA